MDVRKFQEKDRESLIALWKRVFPDDPPHNDPSRVLSAKLEIDDLIFVAEQDNQVVGACMAGYDGHRGWLYAVAVSPELRRAGVGTSLVSTAVAELKKLGCIKVNLQIRSTNTAVAEFYKSLGFSVEDRLSMGVFVGDRGSASKKETSVVRGVPPGTNKQRACSFCGEHSNEYEKLFRKEGFGICSRCLAVIDGIAKSNGFTHPHAHDTTACSFCGKQQREGVSLVAGPGVFICNVCSSAFHASL